MIRAPRNKNNKNILGNQNGNVLFLVLIAVALFAALSFAMSQGNRGSGNAGRENVKIAASQIIQYGISLESASTRLRVSKGVAAENFSFETDFMSDYSNPSCTDDECRVFLPTGGGAVYTKPEKKWLDSSKSGEAHWGRWLFTGASCVPGVGLGGDDTCAADASQTDLIAFIPWIQRDICAEIDRKLGIPLNGDLPPQDQGDAWIANPVFTGTFTTGEAISTGGPAFFNKPEGCFEGNGTPPAGTYHYYRVIAAR